MMRIVGSICFNFTDRVHYYLVLVVLVLVHVPQEVDCFVHEVVPAPRSDRRVRFHLLSRELFAQRSELRKPEALVLEDGAFPSCRGHELRPHVIVSAVDRLRGEMIVDHPLVVVAAFFRDDFDGSKDAALPGGPDAEGVAVNVW